MVAVPASEYPVVIVIHRGHARSSLLGRTIGDQKSFELLFLIDGRRLAGKIGLGERMWVGFALSELGQTKPERQGFIGSSRWKQSESWKG